MVRRGERRRPGLRLMPKPARGSGMARGVGSRGRRGERGGRRGTRRPSSIRIARVANVGADRAVRFRPAFSTRPYHGVSKHRCSDTKQVAPLLTVEGTSTDGCRTGAKGGPSTGSSGSFDGSREETDGGAQTGDGLPPVPAAERAAGRSIGCSARLLDPGLRRVADGAAPESNRASLGLPDLTSFEDPLGHRPPPLHESLIVERSDRAVHPVAQGSARAASA